MSDKMLKKILVVISENFSNGVRADFITENQIRRAFKLRYSDEEIPGTFSVTAFIKKSAFYYGGKYYFFTAFNRGQLFRLIDATLKAGNVIVFYDAFFERYRGKLSDWHVKTPAQLRSLLLMSGKRQYHFSDKYFSLNKCVRLNDVIEHEVRSLPAGIPFSIEQLRDRLPYVPSIEIERILNQPRKYSKAIDGRYLLTEQLAFDLFEIKNVRASLLRELESDGYATFNVQAFPKTLASNSEFGELTIGGVVFDRFLSKHFSRHGTILTARGGAGDAGTLLRRFCELHDELTLSELVDRAKILGINRQNLVVDAANESMIRVSKNTFVRDALVKFNTAAIDNALTNLVCNRIVALRDVTNFTTFAPVKDIRGFDLEWNLYLLESFLRKISRRYTFHLLKEYDLMNGVICPCGKIFSSYVDLMSEVVMQEKIPLETKSIDAFLTERNFRLRRVDKLSTLIIARAQLLSLAI